jgi:hypothetical protein
MALHHFLTAVFNMYCWGDPGIDGRIILGWTFRRWD